MNLITKISTSILTFVLTFLTRFLSAQFKRSFLLTTVYTRCYEEHVFATHDLARLNLRLNVACNLAAMESMSQLGSRIWKDVPLKDLLENNISCNLNGECVSQAETMLVCRRIAEATPSWLKYDKNEMVKDLALLFYMQPAHSIANA